MANVYKKMQSRPIPEGATITKGPDGRSYATWQPARGRKQQAPLSLDGTKIVKTSSTWSAKYRAADGRTIDISTGCTDKRAAESKLADLVRQEELVRGGIITSAELRSSRASEHDIYTHLAAYLTSLRAKQDSQRHIADTKRLASRLIDECGFERLSDIDAEPIEAWLVAREKEGSTGARTRNSYLQALSGFCTWAVRSKRLSANPVQQIKRANELVDTRRKRRALSVVEMQRLLYVARARPLAEYGRATIRRLSDELPLDGRSRATWSKAPLTLDTLDEATERAKASLSAASVAKFERMGRERAIVYQVALYTGLRLGELASLTLGSLDLIRGSVTIAAKDEKARRGATIPLHAELVAELKLWVESEGLKRTDKLFSVPKTLVYRLNQDLAVAGIAKKDERGRTLDVHALRHSFGTMLTTSGVAPRVAQAAMRHSRLELTMQLYTDESQLDVAGAMKALPSLKSG